MAIASVLILEVSSATFQEVRQKLIELGHGDRAIYRKIVSIPKDAEIKESLRMDGIFLREKSSLTNEEPA